MERILIRSIPYFCLIAYNIHPLVTAFNLEISFSSLHLPSYPTNAKSLPFSFSVTVFVSPGSRETFSKFRKRILSGVLLATKSLENNNTLSFSGNFARVGYVNREYQFVVSIKSRFIYF